MNSRAVLLSAKRANLVGCEATQANMDLLNSSMIDSFKTMPKKISSHAAFCSKNHQFLSLIKTCSIACLPKSNLVFIQKILVSRTLFLPHSICQISCRLSNGFNDTHARLIN